jgi:hypothetical protein
MHRNPQHKRIRRYHIPQILGNHISRQKIDIWIAVIPSPVQARQRLAQHSVIPSRSEAHQRRERVEGPAFLAGTAATSVAKHTRQSRRPLSTTKS